MRKGSLVQFFSSVFFLCLIVMVSGCQQEASKTDDPPTETTPLTYLALGDSYTIGESVDSTGRYPVQLTAQLKAAQLDMAAPKIIATTGWTTAELQTGIDKANLTDTFDLVSLLIGVNNQFRGVARGYTLEAYEQEFEALLDQSIAFAGGNKDRVFVVSIPDYAYSPYGQANNPTTISEGIDEYNAANRRIAAAKDVRYFYITDISRRGVIEPDLVASDGLHPSAKQYGLWVDSFSKEVLELFE